MGKTKDKDKAEETEEREFPTIKPTFLPGQIVWLIDDDDVDEEYDCPACKAHGQIKLYDEEAYDCPKCHGKGQLKRKVVEFFVKSPALVYEFDFTCTLKDQAVRETYDLKLPEKLAENDARFKTGKDLDWENATAYRRVNRIVPLLIAPTYEEAIERAETLTKTDREAKEREEAEKRKKQQEEAKEKARKNELMSAMK